MGGCRGIKWSRYIHGIHEGRFSQGRLAPAIRIQRLLNAFEASVTVAAVDGGPSVQFCVFVCINAGQTPAVIVQLVKERTDLAR